MDAVPLLHRKAQDALLGAAVEKARVVVGRIVLNMDARIVPQQRPANLVNNGAGARLDEKDVLVKKVFDGEAFPAEEWVTAIWKRLSQRRVN